MSQIFDEIGNRLDQINQQIVPTLETKLNEVSLLQTQQISRNQQLLEKSRKVQNKKSKLLEMAREMEHLLKNLNHQMKTVEQNLNEEVLTGQDLNLQKELSISDHFLLEQQQALKKKKKQIMQFSQDFINKQSQINNQLNNQKAFEKIEKVLQDETHMIKLLQRKIVQLKKNTPQKTNKELNSKSEIDLN
ncbi:hypothetical protein M0813_16612 [Anaeramoeba flamelloides]|uniref:Uncharacterized protein n=1 Tax=Anaeramoeba flamelloides TaxID=1746091 RepID=A0ABQ8YZD7_9EUKA|nr:hypothetical protein M0813_16612 [Anaeramoeba flamelloides]